MARAPYRKCAGASRSKPLKTNRASQALSCGNGFQIRDLLGGISNWRHQRIMPIIAEAWEGEVPVITFDEEAYQRWREQRRRGRGRRSNQN